MSEKNNATTNSQPNENKENYCSLVEVTKILNIAPSTARRMARAGIFKGAFRASAKRIDGIIVASGPWRVPQSSIDDYIRERQEEVSNSPLVFSQRKKDS